MNIFDAIANAIDRLRHGGVLHTIAIPGSPEARAMLMEVRQAMIADGLSQTFQIMDATEVEAFETEEAETGDDLTPPENGVLFLIQRGGGLLVAPGIQSMTATYGGPTDGSKLFTGTDSSYLAQHLSDGDLELVQAQMDQGKDFSHLTEEQIVQMFP